MLTTRRGRRATTGRYETREELERMVRAFYAEPGRSMLDVARVCRVSHGVVASILNKAPAQPDRLAKCTAAFEREQARADRAELQAEQAITHLHALLNQRRTATQMLEAERAAREWLVSIGSEPQ